MTFVDKAVRRAVASTSAHLSESSATTLCLAASVLVLMVLLALVRLARRRLSTLPPGPWSWPVVGILPKIDKEFHLFLADYAKTYGKLFTCRMGQQNMLVISDHKLVKKIMQRREFSGRPKSELMSLLGGYGETKALDSGFLCTLFISIFYLDQAS